MSSSAPGTLAAFQIDHMPDRTIDHQGQSYLFFSGTSYLGMVQHPAMHALLAEGLSRYGLHFGSSRNGNLQLQVFAEAEAKLAALVEAPAALTVSSGMLAGQVVVDWLASVVGPDAVGYQAPGTHPALWHPLLKAHVNPFTQPAGTSCPAYVLANSVDAIRSKTYSFNWLAALPTDQLIYLVVDDSHGLGILNNGRGIWSQLTEQLTNHPNVKLIVTASLAKAMGLPGGVIFSDPGTLASLRQTAYFGACSPMPPAYAHAYVQSGNLYADAYKRLARNLALARQLLIPTRLFQQAEGYPVFYTDHDEIAPYLLGKGIFVYSFAYPTAADKANTRVVISAYHTPDDLAEIAFYAKEFARSL
ncbi:aminotransferase class I/II-fold pyridoxal phosphate-dependent enzyme [Fibrella forsythiae]|uniref:Pyridoxal phosphate-dependent aminotransferase family protein n=1 Tax=Fibrella forsythiae TaxID=2817061 RepID=A0ABS3JFR4_9BACT|nr:aminotransferase class I/II-fold pyridoxal phosphate-dependent enzyme [Fibrella forsythiae]MBO0948837.1 pyridoxal phosphate-dependent aminotransferase family protein [Fibrella forsythiae]